MICVYLPFGIQHTCGTLACTAVQLRTALVAPCKHMSTTLEPREAGLSARAALLGELDAPAALLTALYPDRTWHVEHKGCGLP